MKTKMMMLAIVGIFISLASKGELPPSRQWWQKIGFNAFGLYRSCDLIGEAQISAVNELTPLGLPVGGLNLTVTFTNMLKGSPGKYIVTLPEDMRWTRGFSSIPDSLPAYIKNIHHYPMGGLNITVVITGVVEQISASMLPYETSVDLYPPIAQLIDTNGIYWGKSGQRYALACEGRGEYIELQAIIPPEIWATFSDQVAAGNRQHEEWVKAKKARDIEIEILELKLKDALDLGDIDQSEYDRRVEQQEPMREERQKIESELWEDRANYKYFDESRKYGEP